MRELMHEDAKLQEKIEKIEEKKNERNIIADRLVEKWSKKPGIGKGLREAYDKAPDKIRGTSIILENQENALQKLTETQISTAFSTTPENVMKIIRLGYPNSVRGEIFYEWAMQTSRDSIYYLYPQYDSTQRGSTASAITIQSPAYRFASEITQDVNPHQGDGSTVTYNGTTSIQPLVPYTVRVYVGNTIVGADNGSGIFPETDGGDNLPIGISTGTINYTYGTYSITFSTAPAVGYQVTIEYNYNSEISTDYGYLGQIQLQLRDYQFRVRPYPLGVSWSKMTELLLGTTLNIDAEEALIRGAADELKKSLDFQACRLGYTAANTNLSVTFDASASAGGEDSIVMRAQSLTNAIGQAGNVMFNAIQRGGVTKIVGGPSAIEYAKLHKRFDGAGAQPKIGIHKVGSLDGIDFYKAPIAIVPDNTLLCVWRNDDLPEDVSIAFGTLIPLYKTQKLEFMNLYSQQGLAHFGDNKILNSSILSISQLTI